MNMTVEPALRPSKMRLRRFFDQLPHRASSSRVETSSGNNYFREKCVHAFHWITELNDREGVAAVSKTDNSSAIELGGSALDLR